MKRIIVTAVVLALGLFLLSCDSSDNSGGGAADSSGYSLADLAGVWLIKASPAQEYAATFKIRISSDGKVVSIKAKGASNCGASAQFDGVFSVSADGSVQATGMFRCASFWGTNQYLYRKYELTFASATELYGRILNLGWWVKGVGWSAYTPNKFNVTFVKVE